jgi:guanylate kinase
MTRKGSLIIVSGPSGAGKSALVAEVLATMPGLSFSVSCTTRMPRGSERNGVEYHFVTKDEFESRIARNEFLEWAEVYGNYYGTESKFIEDRLMEGRDVLLDIDVQGAKTLRQKRPDATTIFIMPPSYQILRKRLESRRLDKQYVIEQRLKIARNEIVHFRNYEYIIVNDSLDLSVQELKAILLGSRCRMALRTDAAESIIDTFGGMDDENP